MLSQWLPTSIMTASHLVASSFDKATLTAIFGKAVDDEAFFRKK